jgi:hypothetical protein
MRIELSQINAAIASAAPKEGQPWSPEAIASAIAQTIAKEAEDERAWQEGRAGWQIQFTGSGVAPGNPEAIDAMREAAIARHSAAVAQKIASNQILISAIGGAVVAAGTMAMGGAPAAAILPQLLPVAIQIAGALNQQPATTVAHHPV